MPIINAANRIEDRKIRREEGVRTDYARLEIDLGNTGFVGTDIEIAVSGSYLAKISYDGNDTAYFRLDKRHAGKIYADEFKSVRRGYERLWLTNPVAQTGKKLILQIGQIEYAEIVPDDYTERTFDEMVVLNTATDIDDSSWNPGSAKVMMAGGYVEAEIVDDSVDDGDAVAISITTERRVRTEPLVDLMETDRLVAAADAGVDTIAAPGVGYAIEVLGYMINQHEEAAMVLLTTASLKFDADQYIWEGISNECGVTTNHISIANNLRVRGAENEALTLTNTDDNAAAAGSVVAIVYYRVVSV